MQVMHTQACKLLHNPNKHEVLPPAAVQVGSWRLHNQGTTYLLADRTRVRTVTSYSTY